MHRRKHKEFSQHEPMRSKPFWVCPQFETLQRMREDPERFFPGERAPHYCSTCTGPGGSKYPHECVIWGEYGFGKNDLNKKKNRLRLAKRINRTLRKRKNQLTAESRQRNRRRQNESSRI